MLRDTTDLPHVRVDRREFVRADTESFDRVAFALHALRLLQPPQMTVAVFEGCFGVRAQSGWDLRNGPNAKWAMLSVAPHASRVEIALAVAGLAGRERDPYMLDLVLAPVTRAV